MEVERDNSLTTSHAPRSRYRYEYMYPGSAHASPIILLTTQGKSRWCRPLTDTSATSNARKLAGSLKVGVRVLPWRFG
jgi:hypothetical protein